MNEYDALPEQYKAMIQVAAQAQVIYTYAETEATQFGVMAEMRDEYQVQVKRSPDDMLSEDSQVWLEVIKEKSATDPLFKKVADHFLDYRKKYATWAIHVLKPTYQK